VELAISEMKAGGAHEVSFRFSGGKMEMGSWQIALETEYDNKGSLALYDSIGFLREKRIHGFYSNLKDA
jgi:ribosomal protein S18 acetylase RimI-like enzyme